MNLITKILTTLPQSIEYDGCYFVFEIFIAHQGRELRAGYILDTIYKTSPHFGTAETLSWVNPFEQSLCGHLVLEEGIQTDTDMAEAIDRIAAFLRNKNLHEQ